MRQVESRYVISSSLAVVRAAVTSAAQTTRKWRDSLTAGATAEMFTWCSRLPRESSALLAAARVSDGSVAEWLACWTQAQKDPGSNRSRDTVI